MGRFRSTFVLVLGRSIIICDTCGVGIAHCKSQYSYCGETVRHVSHCLGDDVIIVKLPGICNRTAENYLIQSCDATNVFCIGTV